MLHYQRKLENATTCYYKRQLREGDIYILESLLGAPPVTLATRRRASSAFRSFNCVERSDFDFSLNSWTLILAVHNPFHINPVRKISQKANRRIWNDGKMQSIMVENWKWYTSLTHGVFELSHSVSLVSLWYYRTTNPKLKKRKSDNGPE